MPSNKDAEWGDFNPDQYAEHNYLERVRDDDAWVIRSVRDHFAAFHDRLGEATAGIDVGSGPNIVPALLLAGVVEDVTLMEFSPANCAWLQREVHNGAPDWTAYWDILAEEDLYWRAGDPRATLQKRATVVQGDVLNPPRGRQYQAGTMFYVAESISSVPEEFQLALENFLSLLSPGAPFGIAFMENSTGYTVSEVEFPALPVTTETVQKVLDPMSSGLEVQRIGISGNVLRAGYTGMLLALGTVPMPIGSEAPATAQATTEDSLVTHVG